MAFEKTGKQLNDLAKAIEHGKKFKTDNDEEFFKRLGSSSLSELEEDKGEPYTKVDSSNTKIMTDDQICLQISCLSEKQQFLLYLIIHAPKYYGARFAPTRYLASKTGLTDRYISKCLAKFRKAGWIKISLIPKLRHKGNCVTFVHHAVYQFFIDNPPKAMTKGKI